MSWDEFVNNLTSSEMGRKCDNCDRACIIGLDGSKCSSDNHTYALRLTSEEVANIADVFKSTAFPKFEKLMAEGVVAEGIKYMFLREEDGKIVLAKRDGHGALVLQATKTMIIIAHVVEAKQHAFALTRMAVHQCAKGFEMAGV